MLGKADSEAAVAGRADTFAEKASVSSSDPPSRDPAVDAALTAETLLGQFVALIPRLTSLLPADVSIAMGEAQGLYPELWAALDRGRATLRERGLDLPAYDEVRARQPTAMLGFEVHSTERSELMEATAVAAYMLGGVVAGTAVDVVGSLGAKRGEADHSGLADARSALKALRSAMPNVDWGAVDRTEARAAALAIDEIARARRRKVLVGFGALAIAVVVGIGLVELLQRSPTQQEENDREQAQFREAQQEIHALDDVLRKTPCDVNAAERRVSLLQLHAQTTTARKHANQFIGQCGENATMRSVVGATSSGK